MKQTRITYRNLGGMDQSKDSGRLMPDGKKPVCGDMVFGMLAGKGSLDGRCGVGTDSLSGLAGALKPQLREHKWETAGHTYHLGYQSDGSGVDGQLVFWADVEPSSSATAATAITGLAGVLPTNFIPCFADPGNGYLYVACGQKGVYRLAVTTPGTVITATAITTLPATSFIGIANNKLWLIPMDESMIVWGPVGDYERLQPKMSEIEADTYGIDYRLTYQSQGLEGNTTGFFVSDAYKIAWTQKDGGIIIGDGNKGTTAFSRLPGFGLRNQLGYIQKDGVLYWQSGYKGGRILGGTMGSAPSGVEVLKAVTSQQFSFFVWDASDRIADVLNDCPQGDCQIVSKVLDSRADWEDTTNNINSNSNLDTTDEPGLVKLGGISSDVTFTASTAITRNSIFPVTLAVSGTYPLAKLYDNDPATTSDGYTSALNYCSIAITAPLDPVYGQFTIMDFSVARSVLVKDAAGNNLKIAASNAVLSQQSSLVWQKLKFDVPVTTTALLLVFSGRISASGGWPSPDYEWTLTLNFGATKTIAEIDVYDMITTGNGTTVCTHKIGEIILTGGTAVTETVITSQVFKITGLTSANNALGTNARAAGRFFARYLGVDADGTGGLGPATGLNTEAVANIQIRGDDHTFAYNATNATLAWVDAVAATTTGFDLDGNAEFAPHGTTDGSNALGDLYVQFRIPIIRNTAGTSTKIDCAGFYFWTGNNQKSISPAGMTQDFMFFGIRQNSDSANPDMEIVRSDNGEWTVLKGKQPFSYLNHRDQCYICEGTSVYKQFDGVNNYDPSGASDYMERRWRSGAIQVPGADVYLNQLQFHVDKYEGIKTQQTTANSLVDAIADFDGVTNAAWDRKSSFIGYDGYLYTVLPSSTGANLTDLKLYRIDQCSGTKTSYTIKTNADTASLIVDYDCAMRPDGKFIYITYWTITGTLLRCAVYDVVNRKLIRNETIFAYTDGAYAGIVCTGVTCEYLNGVLHFVMACRTTAGGTASYAHHWYCENPDDDSLGFYTLGNGTATITDYAATNVVPRMFKNSDGYLSLIYGTLSTGKLYHREYRPADPIVYTTTWSAAVEIASLAGANAISYLRYKDNDYVVRRVGGITSALKRKPTWTALTVAAITNPPADLLEIEKVNPVSVNKDNDSHVYTFLQEAARTPVAILIAYNGSVYIITETE